MTITFLVRANGHRRRLGPGDTYELKPGDKLLSFPQEAAMRFCSNCGKFFVTEER